MITCDLCGGAKDCLPKEIAGREYDICSACWNALAEKLQGKGRRIRETVFLPSPRTPKEREEEEPPLPGGPPGRDRKSTRLNSSHVSISYAVFCLKKKNIKISIIRS